MVGETNKYKFMVYASLIFHIWIALSGIGLLPMMMDDLGTTIFYLVMLFLITGVPIILFVREIQRFRGKR